MKKGLFWKVGMLAAPVVLAAGIGVAAPFQGG